VIVADASVVVDLLLGPGSEAGDLLSDHLAAGDVVCAPHLVDAEVGQVLRRLAARGVVTDDEARSMLDILDALPIERYPHTGLMLRAFAMRGNVTVYDALYLALAEAIERPLLTGDGRLAQVPGCAAEVRVVGVG
jgi:predicted nucleic acid-binding protein